MTPSAVSVMKAFQQVSFCLGFPACSEVHPPRLSPEHRGTASAEPRAQGCSRVPHMGPWTSPWQTAFQWGSAMMLFTASLGNGCLVGGKVWRGHGNQPWKTILNVAWVDMDTWTIVLMFQRVFQQEGGFWVMECDTPSPQEFGPFPYALHKIRAWLML